MQLNGTQVVDRHNRPTVIQKVALRAFFINDGEYYDPYQVSGVTIVAKVANLTPSGVLDNNVVASSIASGTVLMQFAPSAAMIGSAMAPTSYNPASDPSCLSGVYRTATGQYMCVLDGTQTQTGLYTYHGSSVHITNSASAVDDYLDIWTIKFNSGSDNQSLVQNFHLYNDTFFTTTQPVILTARNRLVNKHLTLSSITNLNVTTEVTIANKDIDDSIKNIFKDSCITSAMMKIEKVNEDAVSLPSHVNVSGYTDTSSLVEISSDNTIIFKFDTTTLAAHPNVADFAGLTGTYRATVKYNLLNETIISPPAYFTIS